MNQKTKTSALFFLMFSLSLSAIAQQTPTIRASNSKPNIVVILSDDQGNADAGYQRMVEKMHRKYTEWRTAMGTPMGKEEIKNRKNK